MPAPIFQPNPAKLPKPDPIISEALLNKKRFRILGLTPDDIIKYFFQGNAAVAILVLVLIMVFLLREGAGFFGQNLRNLRIYRLAGLEYVDFIKHQVDQHTALTREANALRMRQFDAFLAQGKDIEEANRDLASYDAFTTALGDAVEDVRGIASELTEAATAIKEKEQIYRDTLEQKAMLLRANRTDEANAVIATPVDFASEVSALKAMQPAFNEANQQFASKLKTALATGGLQPLQPQCMEALEKLKQRIESYANSLAATEARMSAWSNQMPVPWHESLTAFLFGREWLTASFWQDWYGIVPLFIGSLLVSVIALIIAVPLGVAGAIYVSEIASPGEKSVIKPYIEFIAAIPSVVLGFFGVAVLGQTLRLVSQAAWLSWVPGFPMSERLNSLTAGCLLAFMAIPTIFSLAEDALNNVPKHFKEASYALGATD